MKQDDIFEKYRQLKLDLSVLEIQIQSHYNISEDDMIQAMTFGGAPEGERVQTSGTSDKTCGIALHFRDRMRQENEEYFQFLLKKHRKVKEEVEFFENSVRTICRDRADIVFDLMEGIYTWDEIADRNCISRMTVSRVRKDAIRQLNEMVRRKAQQETEYIFN